MVTEERRTVASQFATDPSRWRLDVSHGRQTWRYLSEQESAAKSCRPQSRLERYWLGTLADEDDEHLAAGKVQWSPHSDAHEAALHGFEFFSKLQTADGHWAGEYGGPLFLLPGLIITCHVTGVDLGEPARLEIVRYIRATQASDGGWALHVEGETGIVLCTSLNYVALRILGVPASDAVCVLARDFLLRNGGTTGVPSWGKFWLAVMNVYDWDGVQPLLPELWLLPDWMPMHPARTWCHARQIYLPMSFCYAHRVTAPDSELVQQLRQELYVENYADINWPAARNAVAAVDCYAPHHVALDAVNVVMAKFESYHSTWLRERALQKVIDHVRAEDLNSNYIGIGPISKTINMLCTWFCDGPESLAFKSHVARIPDYLWLGHDGMRMNGTNGSQLWDTALAAQAMVEAGITRYSHFLPVVNHALEFLDDCQVKQNIPDSQKYYRGERKGAFPFSTLDCGWIVSDCTAEGVKSAILLQQHSNIPKLLPSHRLFEGVNVLLGMQNSDGGFASYERRRGSTLLEMFNPSEVFGEIMVDYSYVECSSAVTQCLTTFKKVFPDHRTREIDQCVTRAIKFIKSVQREDGSWFGSWGVCFTYGTWFGVEALVSVGESYANSKSVQAACDFLVSKQMPDGGWGESYKACIVKEYVQHPKQSQVVNTAWACLALMAAGYPDEEPVRRGIQLIMSRQQPSGEWRQEAIEGVFNKTCMISYPNYKFIFSIWALGRYARLCQEGRLQGQAGH